MLVPEVLSDKTQNNTTNIPVPRSRNITDVTGLFPLQQSLEIGSYVNMLVREVLSDKTQNNTKKIPVPRSRNITDVTGLFPLQQSLE